MPRLLPNKPSLRYLKEEAKDLLKAHGRGDAACCPVLRRLRRFAQSSDQEVLSADVGLQEVQFALAMDYGFANWHHLARAAALREHVLSRMNYWERFGPAAGFENSPEGKLQGILADPGWMQLAEMEMQLGPLSEPCRKIRRQIACLESCHESYLRNVESILHSIGTMTPGQIFDCGWACSERRAEAAAYVRALEIWLSDQPASLENDARVRQARELLGDVTDDKARLVRHLIAKLRDNAYKVSPGQEDFATVESRIQHLDICNFNWPPNLRILLAEIAAGKQLAPWHAPEGFNAHGDCPDRIPTLQPILAEVTAWITGKQGRADGWPGILGEVTPEKRWLAACLCKNVIAQHDLHAADTRLAKLVLS